MEAITKDQEKAIKRLNSDDFNEEFRSKWNPIMTQTEQLINKINLNTK